MAISPLETLLIQKAKKEIVFVHKKIQKKGKMKVLEQNLASYLQI